MQNQSVHRSYMQDLIDFYNDISYSYICISGNTKSERTLNISRYDSIWVSIYLQVFLILSHTNISANWNRVLYNAIHNTV